MKENLFTARIMAAMSTNDPDSRGILQDVQNSVVLVTLIVSLNYEIDVGLSLIDHINL